ncbi:hypothetical protein [Bizionia sp.]|uniref:hypothetical protein n=1 Tax=Bizionia sp. TaxID=1954480 RepID=UPI003A8EC5D4
MNKYQTPKDVAEYMVSLLPNDIRYVLEPTPGKGNLVKALQAKNIKVKAPIDYFLLDKHERFPAIVMNPPFSSKSLNITNAPKEYIDSGMKCGYNMLFECMGMTNHVIALMPWYTISDSDVRMRHIMAYGLKSLTVLPRKTFNYARIQTCIIQLDRGFKGDTRFTSYEFLKLNK